MASSNSGDRKNRKASSLTDTAAVSSRRPADAPAVPAKDGKDALQASTAPVEDHRGVKVAVDLIMIVVVIGILVGGIFGYRALKNAYAPAWEERTVTVVLELTDVNPAHSPLKNGSMYIELSDGPLYLGRIIDGTRTEMPATDDQGGLGGEYCRVILETTARYRAEKGYYIGDYPLLAGISDYFRIGGSAPNGDGGFGGYIAEGTILAVYEPGEEDTTEGTEAGETVARDPAPAETTAGESAPEVTAPEETTTESGSDTGEPPVNG